MMLKWTELNHEGVSLELAEGQRELLRDMLLHTYAQNKEQYF